MTRIETTQDRARVDHDELVAAVAAHIERSTGRKVDGAAHLSSEMGSTSTKWSAFAHLTDKPVGLWLEFGAEYMHSKWGRVMFVSSHPHDGACKIIQRMETANPFDDDLVLDTCERSDLSPAEGRLWPFLGFTTPPVKEG